MWNGIPYYAKRGRRLGESTSGDGKTILGEETSERADKLECVYKCMWEQFVVVLPLNNYPI